MWKYKYIKEVVFKKKEIINQGVCGKIIWTIHTNGHLENNKKFIGAQ